jgi:DNA topoisomerase-2
MYVGDIKNTESSEWVHSDNKMIKMSGTWNPGIYKIFDEIITNSSDEVQRNKNVTNIKVEISSESISVFNDSGIPIEIHPEYKVYIPELIFSNLLTSSNFDDTQQRTTGGLNGLGAKLTAIFSSEFIIETCSKGKKYVQKFEKNLSIINKPSITKSKQEYTKITFKPDYERFGMKTLDDFTKKILEKRVYDIGAITPSNVAVFLNSKNIKIKDFSDYISLYIGDKKTCPRTSSNCDKWKVTVAPSDNGFQCVSFVNGIYTSDGGTHVEHVLAPIMKKLTEMIQEKHKNVSIKPQYIRDNIFVFINCLIVNPSFSSQTKEKNITKASDFGSKFLVPDELIKNIYKLGIVESIINLAEAKEKKQISKSDGKKTNRVIISKLDDANKAGTKDSKLCTIIFTEGDSAKTTAISGMSVVGRDYYGAFPLRGKLLNTRTATYAQLSKNEELNNIKQILGLQAGKKYKNLSELRYGKIMIMTDADTDGFHIKSLLINFIGNGWPELLKQNFISSMITPVIKLSKRNNVLPFYNLSDYNKWKDSNDISGWKVKYYKGLGTSTREEAREYFKNMKTLSYISETKDDDKSLELAFTKTEADNRKKWILNNIKSPKTLDYNQNKVNIKDLIDKELVLFSIEDNIRSIPNLVDGLKPSQRKIIYACIKRNLTNEIKVSQLAGYVSEHTSYHHGEQSLQDTIINLAQEFVGSNNINLLEPVGQFGSRLYGGKDASSPRYIFTKLSKNFKDIFNPDDYNLLEYLNDDGDSIEPKFYVPTMPMILINGACGIGTGFSSDVPSFNPDDIKERLLRLVQDEDADIPEMTPWYKDFKGIVKKSEYNKWTTHGKYSVTSNVITVTELPVGTWTNDYKIFLDRLETENIIYSYKNNSTESNVYFEIKFPLETVIEWTDNREIEKKLKLVSHLSANNMYVFNENNEIVKMETPEEIIYHFWRIRNEYYSKRKEYLVNKLKHELDIISNKIRFVNDIMDENVIVFKKKLTDIRDQLTNKDYKLINDSYDYLTDMKIHTFSEDTLNTLNNKCASVTKEYTNVSKTKLKDFWLQDLN